MTSYKSLAIEPLAKLMGTDLYTAYCPAYISSTLMYSLAILFFIRLVHLLYTEKYKIA
jgi:hypothetical protein